MKRAQFFIANVWVNLEVFMDWSVLGHYWLTRNENAHARTISQHSSEYTITKTKVNTFIKMKKASSDEPNHNPMNKGSSNPNTFQVVSWNTLSDKKLCKKYLKTKKRKNLGKIQCTTLTIGTNYSKRHFNH